MECWLYDEDKWPSGSGGGETARGIDSHLGMALTWVEEASSLPEDSFENAIAFTVRDPHGTMQSSKEKPVDLTGVGAFVEQRLTRDEKSTFSFPWSPDFAAFFEKMHGYSPL